MKNPCEDCQNHHAACEISCQKLALADVNHPDHKLALFFDRSEKELLAKQEARRERVRIAAAKAEEKKTDCQA